MALRHDLRADDDIDSAFRDPLNSLRMVSIEVIRSLDNTMVRASGNTSRRFLLHAFDARPDRDERFLARQFGHAFGFGIEKPQ